MLITLNSDQYVILSGALVVGSVVLCSKMDPDLSDAKDDRAGWLRLKSHRRGLRG